VGLTGSLLRLGVSFWRLALIALWTYRLFARCLLNGVWHLLHLWTHWLLLCSGSGFWHSLPQWDSLALHSGTVALEGSGSWLWLNSGLLLLFGGSGVRSDSGVSALWSAVGSGTCNKCCTALLTIFMASVWQIFALARLSASRRVSASQHLLSLYLAVSRQLALWGGSGIGGSGALLR
jgi:hypothetical protein